jgi:hypothetical protein
MDTAIRAFALVGGLHAIGDTASVRVLVVQRLMTHLTSARIAPPSVLSLPAAIPFPRACGHQVWGTNGCGAGSSSSRAVVPA